MKTWVELSDSQRKHANVKIRDDFRAYIAELGLTEEDASNDPNLWESWGLKGFKDAADAVTAKADVPSFIFTPEVSIDMIEDEEVRKKALAILHNRVNEDQDKLIKQEILRRKDVLRQRLANLDTETITKYENRLVEK